MKLMGARVALGATAAEHIDLDIERGRIRPWKSSTIDGPELDLAGYLILPGLINCHDHLEFNLFPRLGRGPYDNASSWAADGTPLRRSASTARARSSGSERCQR